MGRRMSGMWATSLAGTAAGGAGGSMATLNATVVLMGAHMAAISSTSCKRSVTKAANPDTTSSAINAAPMARARGKRRGGGRAHEWRFLR